MTHLTPDELIDAVEGLLDADRRAHLDACAACRSAVAELTATLRTTQQVDVPEPSPLFWDHFSARVRQAVDAAADPVGGGWWPAFLGWRVLVPVAGLALLVLALVFAMPRQAPVETLTGLAPGSVRPDSPPSRPEEPQGPLWRTSRLPSPGDAGGWELVGELVATVDWDTATAAGLGVRPGAAELAAFELSTDEQQELRRLLDAELKRPRS